MRFNTTKVIYSALCLISVLLTACGSGGGGGAAATSVAPTIAPRFAYAANFNDGTVSMYTVNAATGQLRHNGYAVAGTNPISVTVDPGGKFAYVANRGDNSISAYTIGANGTLTQINCSVACNGNNFATGGNPWGITIDPSGRFAYVANSGSSSISAYSIDATTGALAQILCGAVSPCHFNGAVYNNDFEAGNAPRSVTIDPTGKFAYAANWGSNDIAAYSIGATGKLTQIDADPNTAGIQNFLAGTNPMSVTIDPTGKFAYVANSFNGGLTGNSVSAYSINPTSGMLTTIDFKSSGGTQPQSVTVHPSGKFAYVTNYLSGGVTGYSIGSTGVLAMLMQPVGGWVTGTNPYGVTIDPSGKFAYVANQGSNDVSTYGINPDGTLTIAGRSAGRSGNLAIAMTHGTAAVTYTPKFAYTANQTSSDISAYSIGSTGLLTSLGASVGTTTSPGSVTVDPSGKFAYVGGGLSVMVHPIHADGSLGSGATAAAVTTQSVTVDPSGRFAFVADRVNNNVWAYTINPSTGALTNAGAGVGTGTTPRSVTVDPSGRFAYVANSGSGDVSAYTIAPTTGALTSVGAAVAAGTTSWSVSVDPTGRFAYVANANSGDVSAFSINAATGALTSVGAAVAAGTTPLSVTVDPTGKFAYVANNSSNNVSAYTINPGTGVLVPISGSPFGASGAGPNSVSVDHSGKFLYVGNYSSNNVATFSINATTGALTLLGTYPAATGPVSITTTGAIQ
jgi:6-phosphogluconolactonase (cycloisomerase 2 family)